MVVLCGLDLRGPDFGRDKNHEDLPDFLRPLMGISINDVDYYAEAHRKLMSWSSP